MNKRNGRFSRGVASAAGLTGIVLILSSLPPPPAPGQTSGQTTPGPEKLAAEKSLFTDRCSACHDLPKPEQVALSRDGWRRMVDRMLTKFGASDEITPAEADQIVDYLATFAPKPVKQAKSHVDILSTTDDDVWAGAPKQTRVINFLTPRALVGLIPGGAVPLTKTQSEARKPSTEWTVDPKEEVLLAKQPTASGQRTSFLISPEPAGGNVDVLVDLLFDTSKPGGAGVICGYRDSTRYDIVRVDALDSSVSLLQVAGAAHTVLQQSPSVTPTPPAASDAASRPSTPTGPRWHTLRVMVKGGVIRVWLDARKQINVVDPGYSAGSSGLWIQGTATVSFNHWMIDKYD